MEIVRLKLPECDNAAGVSFLRQYSVEDTYPLHGHEDFFEFFLVLNGRAVHFINGENILLKKGSLVLIRPDDVHSYKVFNRHEFDLISVGFLIPVFERACGYLGDVREILTAEKLPPHIFLDGYSFSDISVKLLALGQSDTAGKRGAYFRSILPFILQTIIADERPPLTIPEKFRALIDAMSERENFIFGLERLNELSGLSQEHMTREFRKYLGMTPTEFINLRRMNYAAELLLQSDHDIADVCYMCGFNNLSHFYHVFKGIYGCPPKQFVKSHSLAITPSSPSIPQP